ncbi:MAG: ABC transporter substrate-binding protein [Burkholderiaceae bacterium]|nr:ABC transporter substrate-binding protein [Burkholderiaceae bacterium]
MDRGATRRPVVMRRRQVTASIAALLVTRGHAAHAQAESRSLRVGVLRPGVPPLPGDDLQLTLLPLALRELGYAEGRNLLIDARWAHGELQQMPALARELVMSACHVVVAVGSAAVQAMKQASSTLPVVMFGNFDPVRLGLVSSLARPGGNVTGVLIAPDGTLAGKRLELLKQVVPQATRIGLLIPDEDSIHQQVLETRAAAKALGVVMPVVTVRQGDYAGAFAALSRERVAGLIVASHQYFVRDRGRIVELAVMHRLPAMYEWREQVIAGGLMTYSTSLHGLYQRVASYVDRIYKGANPGDLPVERPTKFELVVNLRAARAIDLVVPPALLMRADEVIE